MDSTPPLARLEVGARLDRYELLYRLAEGGMATVWLARMHGKRGFKRLVVVKTIKAQYSEDERFEEMFLDEARIASGIQHSNVAQIIDLGESSDALYLAMEWVDGESLARIRREVAKKKVPIPLGITLRIIADLCAGLHAAHGLKDDEGNDLSVVHRDVSPHNVMISTTGVVKVIDFGIAKAKGRASAETSAGFLKGKIAYMSPEQATGDVIDCRTDIWAAGVVLYELLAGKLPYEGDSETETLRAIVSGRPPFMKPDLPEQVRDVVRRALAHSREQRFATALEMQRALDSAAGSLSVSRSAAEIAAFVEEHLKERTATRQKMVATALEGARIRAEAAGEPSSVPSAGTGAFTTSPHIIQPGSATSGGRTFPTGVETLAVPVAHVAAGQPEPKRRGGLAAAAVFIIVIGALGGGALVVRAMASGKQQQHPQRQQPDPSNEASPAPSAVASSEPTAPTPSTGPSATSSPSASDVPPEPEPLEVVASASKPASSGYAPPTKKPLSVPTKSTSATPTKTKPKKPDDDDF